MRFPPQPMDFILNPIFMLLLTFGGLGSFAFLSFIKWRHQRAGTTASNTGVLHHDLTKGRFGPFWSFMVAGGRKGAGLIMLAAVGLVLFDRLKGIYPESQKYGTYDLSDGFTKNSNEVRGSHHPTTSPLGKPMGGTKPMFDDLDQQLADRAREVAAHSATEGQQVGLWNTRDEFVSCYGVPFASSMEGSGPGIAAFHREELSFIVSFRNGRACEIKVLQRAGRRLTDSQIQAALTRFGGAGSGKWTEFPPTSDCKSVVWKRDGAGAMMIENDRAFSGVVETGPVDTLEIITDEHLCEITKEGVPRSAR